MKRILAAAALALAASTAQAQAVTPTFKLQSYYPTAPANTTAIGLKFQARFCLNAPTCDKYITTASDGTIKLNGYVSVVNTFYSNVVQGDSTLLSLKGNVANGSSAVGVKVGNVNALSTAGAKIASFYSDNVTTERVAIDINGAIQIGLGNTTAAPTCDSTQRGKIYMLQGGSGVKDALTVCTKDASNAYGWRTIY